MDQPIRVPTPSGTHPNHRTRTRSPTLLTTPALPRVVPRHGGLRGNVRTPRIQTRPHLHAPAPQSPAHAHPLRAQPPPHPHPRHHEHNGSPRKPRTPSAPGPTGFLQLRPHRDHRLTPIPLCQGPTTLAPAPTTPPAQRVCPGKLPAHQGPQTQPRLQSRTHRRHHAHAHPLRQSHQHNGPGGETRTPRTLGLHHSFCNRARTAIVGSHPSAPPGPTAGQPALATAGRRPPALIPDSRS